MPEGLEAEIWRRAAAPVVGRTVGRVWVDERVAPSNLGGLVAGARITGLERHGKVLTVDTEGPSGSVRLGLHFGMTGRLVVDGDAAIERLEYASGADRADWDRFRLWTDPSQTDDDQPALRMNDPRRLGRVSVDPDLTHLGPDVLSLTSSELLQRLGRKRTAIKVALLDQTVVAGIGNLCADEVLFGAGIAPSRKCDDLTDEDVDAITRACRQRLPHMLRLGGSTTGALEPSVRAGPGHCPRDGAALERSKIGGRTAVWCPHHQC